MTVRGIRRRPVFSAAVFPDGSIGSGATVAVLAFPQAILPFRSTSEN